MVAGTVDGESYEFRKCYSRGCTHNLCPHVSQAVMIANRYLKRDYKTLEKTGITLEENLFSLEAMLAQFENKRDDFVNTLILEDYVHIAKEGEKIAIKISVENFAANFNVDYLGETHICHRCFSCCMTDREREDAQTATELANRRLASIYTSFDQAGITYNRVFFE